MLAVEHVSKHYSGVTALAPTSHDFSHKKNTVIIGPSGCGKSTLLRCLIGLITPDQGRVLVDGNILDDKNILTLRRRIGYVIQEGGLFPHLTARENVSLLASYLGYPKDRVEARVSELSQLLRLSTDIFPRYPSELSGGQRQRLSLMRALVLDPEILLLDEPLGALDPMIRFELQKDLKEIFNELGKTVVMVTHDMAEAGYFADEILLMKDGTIAQKGTFDDLIHRPANSFVNQFISAQRGLTLQGRT
jgi:osmoprotectant transport system ATP-binding protein